MHLKTNRHIVIRNNSFRKVVQTYKNMVNNSWLSVYGPKYKKFVTKFNEDPSHKFTFKLNKPEGGGIKLLYMLKELGYSKDDTLMFVGEAPFYGFLLAMMEWSGIYDKKVQSPQPAMPTESRRIKILPNQKETQKKEEKTTPIKDEDIKIRVSSPEGEEMLTTNLIKLKRQLPQHWFSHSTNNITDQSFKNKLMEAPELSEWFVSDIGFSGSDNAQQLHNQSWIINQLYDIITSSDVGKKGLIIKTYMLTNPDDLRHLATIASLYKTFDIIKPPGSPITNDEVYFVAKDKIHTGLTPANASEGNDLDVKISGSVGISDLNLNNVPILINQGSITATTMRVKGSDIFARWVIHFNKTYNYYSSSLKKLQPLGFMKDKYIANLKRHLQNVI